MTVFFYNDRLSNTTHKHTVCTVIFEIECVSFRLQILKETPQVSSHPQTAPDDRVKVHLKACLDDFLSTFYIDKKTIICSVKTQMTSSLNIHNITALTVLSLYTNCSQSSHAVGTFVSFMLKVKC